MIFFKKYRIRKAYTHLRKNERLRTGSIKPATIESAQFIQIIAGVDSEESYKEMMRIINDLQTLGKKVQSALFFSTKKLPLYITIGEIPENILLFTRKQTDSVFKNPHSILRPFTENQADLLINLCSPSLLISNQTIVYSKAHFRTSTTDSSCYYGDLLVICDPSSSISERYQLIKDTLSIFKNH